MAFIADRLSKWWAIAFLTENGPTKFHHLLTIRETYNRGIAFGLFQGIGPVVGWLTIGVMIGLAIYLVRLPAEDRWTRVGLAMIIGGALGNFIDRVTEGQVLDFIQTSLGPGVFNVADIMIQVGVLLVIIITFWSDQTKPGTL